jgi:hypothetical protein
MSLVPSQGSCVYGVDQEAERATWNPLKYARPLREPHEHDGLG